jgi:hypothetical protein
MAAKIKMVLWLCEHCGQHFHSKAAAIAHEQKCVGKKVVVGSPYQVLVNGSDLLGEGEQIYEGAGPFKFWVEVEEASDEKNWQVELYSRILKKYCDVTVCAKTRFQAEVKAYEEAYRASGYPAWMIKKVEEVAG